MSQRDEPVVDPQGTGGVAEEARLRRYAESASKDDRSRHRFGGEEVESSTHIELPHHWHEPTHPKEADLLRKCFDAGLHLSLIHI